MNPINLYIIFLKTGDPKLHQLISFGSLAFSTIIKFLHKQLFKRFGKHLLYFLITSAVYCYV